MPSCTAINHADGRLYHRGMTYRRCKFVISSDGIFGTLADSPRHQRWKRYGCPTATCEWASHSTAADAAGAASTVSRAQSDLRLVAAVLPF